MIDQPNFSPGDTIQVYQKITEGDKTRTQMFEGVVLSIRGRGVNKMFTARKVLADIAVERIWPLFSPNIEKIKVKGKPSGRIKKAKMFHLRKEK